MLFKTRAFSKFIIITLTAALSLCSITWALEKTQQPHEVNILSWWGDRDPAITKMAYQKCNTKVYYDEYYSNSEFLQRWHSQNQRYDIITFTDSIYNVIKDSIALQDSPLWTQARKYLPPIRNFYFKSELPKNVAYMSLTLTGFLFNPKVINIQPGDSVRIIFAKAKNNVVIVLDDPVEAIYLLNKSPANPNQDLSVKNFTDLIQNTKIYITNRYTNIYNLDNFAFVYTWIGDAIADIKYRNVKYNIYIPPEISHVSIDMLATLNNKPYVNCVAKVLTSKKALSIIHNNDYYFSPYGFQGNYNDPDINKLYQNMLSIFKKAAWKTSPTFADYFKLLNQWKKIKLFVLHGKKRFLLNED
jgi:spermidine/putrescine-binding protein